MYGWENEPRYHLWPSEDINLRVPDVIKKCLGFVGLRQSNGEIRWGGTAFIVSVPGSQYSGYKFDYLVTAKHVADEIAGEDAVVRMNTADGGFVIFELINSPWWFHPTEASMVDAAVTIFAPPPEIKLDVRNIPVRMFLNDKTIADRAIGIGDEIYISGLFTHITETSKNQPVMRTGNIAMMPDEKINFPALGVIDAYVVEARSIGGLSGCPVFIRETVNIPLSETPGGPETRPMHGLGSMYFLGSMIGHWQIPRSMNPALAEAVNMGMSVVVPAYKILEIINQPILADMRKEIEEQRRKEDAESAFLDPSLKRPPMENVFTQQDFEDALKMASCKIEK